MGSEGAIGEFRRQELEEFRSSGVAGVAGVQEFRSSGVQEFRSSGVQEFRSSGVQEFRSSGVAGVQLNDALLSQFFSPANVPHHPRLSSNSVTPELLQLLNSFPELFRRRFYVVLVVDSKRSH